MQWEILSGQLEDKSGQIKYHVRCRYCQTVRILTKPEIDSDKCSCKNGVNKERNDV